MFPCGYSGARVAAFFDKNWHISSHLLLKSESLETRKPAAPLSQGKGQNCLTAKIGFKEIL